ncbi:MAG TPA: hypothetical protein DHW42_10465 [Candidatus Marinimicrobia bacterium]|nr:hypothetical protein [Candidatus Neomarinimicrobiota bacterium]
MEENGGFATLGFLNQKVLKVPNCEWKTKTPFASIRRIVQDERFFFKIKPGLWALKSYKDVILKKYPINSGKLEEEKEFNHSYYQGLLVEIGNIKNFQTFVPNQDKNKKFLNRTLKEITSIEYIFNFSYDNIINRAKTVDVVWFNKRKLPNFMFEVEHTTNINESLLKFYDLQDFNINFYIVADNNRKREYEQKISTDVFEVVKNKTKFLDYDKLAEWHTKSFEIYNLEKNIF